jgi:dephospho-CoA kinase
MATTGQVADAAAEGLRQQGIEVGWVPTVPVALTVAVVGSGGASDADSADVEFAAEDRGAAAAAASDLYRSRLAPWARAVASGRPDVIAPPHLLEHDPGWGHTARRRIRALRQATAILDPADRLGLRRVDHIGSTAVPGLAAKGFLDLQMTLDRMPDAVALAGALAPLGWAPAGGARPDSPGVHRDMRLDDDTAPDAAFAKQLFVAPDPVRPSILHVRSTASPFARRVVRFRDHLRADRSLRRDYEQMKRAAAAAHAHEQDYDDYTRAKSGWLADVYRRLDLPAGGADDPWPLDR